MFPASILVVCAGVMFMSLKGINVEELRRVDRELALASQGKSLRNLLNSPRSRSTVEVGNLDKRRLSSREEPAQDNFSSSSGAAAQDGKRTSYSGDGPAPATSPGSGAVSSSFRLDPDLEKGSHEL